MNEKLGKYYDVDRKFDTMINTIFLLVMFAVYTITEARIFILKV